MWTEDAVRQIIGKVLAQKDQIGASFPHVAYDGKFRYENPSFWTAGFWPGILWMVYEKTGDESVKEIAIQIEDQLKDVLDDFFHIHHDVGFMYLPTAVLHHRLFSNEDSYRTGLKAASHLAGRFNLAGHFIRAWTSEVNPNSTGWAIIDCLMNLPLLFWASKELKDPRFYQIAKAHIETVRTKFVRKDGTVPHIVSFDPYTGEKIENLGGQGYSGDSVWSRGQSWALYGFSIAYRETRDPEYLKAAETIGNWIWEHLPEDLVPYWDFSAPKEQQFARDSSAAACMASGYLELSSLEDDQEKKQKYQNMAEQILQSLLEHYADFSLENQGILQKGTVSFPNDRHINVPIIYGDYFLLEALMKLTEPEFVRIF